MFSGDAPFNVWLATGRHTFCALCDSPDVEVMRMLVAKPVGSFSLAGNQLKFSAREVWVYRCLGCKAEGPAAPKEGK